MPLDQIAIAPVLKSAAIKLFDKIKHHEIKYFCTNGNYSYNKVLPKEKHYKIYI